MLLYGNLDIREHDSTAKTQGTDFPHQCWAQCNTCCKNENNSMFLSEAPRVSQLPPSQTNVWAHKIPWYPGYKLGPQFPAFFSWRPWAAMQTKAELESAVFCHDTVPLWGTQFGIPKTTVYPFVLAEPSWYQISTSSDYSHKAKNGLKSEASIFTQQQQWEASCSWAGVFEGQEKFYHKSHEIKTGLKKAAHVFKSPVESSRRKTGQVSDMIPQRKKL